MRQFTHRFLVRSPLERVAAFHRDTRALKQLTPPPIFVTFNQLQQLEEGSVADFNMWFGPFPVRWVALHSQVGSTGFTDTQTVGPFQQWVHRHSFEPVDEYTTEIVDNIQAQVSTHVFWGLVSQLMWLNLPVLFTYRAWRTKRALEK
jgi:ligand-binding SRPBCC domain-containing protein